MAEMCALAFTPSSMMKNAIHSANTAQSSALFRQSSPQQWMR